MVYIRKQIGIKLPIKIIETIDNNFPRRTAFIETAIINELNRKKIVLSKKENYNIFYDNVEDIPLVENFYKI